MKKSPRNIQRINSAKRTLSSSSSVHTLSPIIQKELENLKETTTNSGWIIKEGIEHVALASKTSSLIPLINKYGIPKFYTEGESSPKATEEGTKKEEEEEIVVSDVSKCTFTAMCRIIIGQQLAIKAADTIWNRFQLKFSKEKGGITPLIVNKIIHQVMNEKSYNNNNIENTGEADSGITTNVDAYSEFKSSIGLSNAKTIAILSLSEAYLKNELSDQILYDDNLSNENLISMLTKVKGIGPWSAHMFLLFHCHRSDLLPLGDLGIRRGIALHFNIKGSSSSSSSSKKMILDEKKDKEIMEEVMEPFRPYRSLACWYLWRVIEPPILTKSSPVKRAKKQEK